MIIKFNDWESYQYRKGAKIPERTQWFKFNNDTPFHDVWKLPSDEFKAYVFLMCEASKNKNSGHLVFDPGEASRKSGIQNRHLIQAIKKLKSYQIISVRDERGMYVEGHFGCSRIEENKNRIEETHVQSAPAAPAPVFDFDSIYQQYPRKEGKKRGMEFLKRHVTTQDQFERLRRSVSNYAAKVAREKTEPRFVKLFSSFVAVFEDYVDLGNPEVTIADFNAFLEEETRKEQAGRGNE